MFLATIYAKKKNYPFYRLADRSNGQRLLRHFRTVLLRPARVTAFRPRR